MGRAKSSESGDDDGDDGDEEDEEEEEEDDEEEDEDDADEDDDEEPRLKYARLTQHLLGVYRNADATSSFLVAGDKMVRSCAIRRHRPAVFANHLMIYRLLELIMETS